VLEAARKVVPVVRVVFEVGEVVFLGVGSGFF
jgi:hypothetical protein